MFFTYTKRIVSMIAVMSVLVPASTAWACWDGYEMHSDTWEMRGDETWWDEDKARAFATWTARISHLAPDQQFESDWGELYLHEGGDPRLDALDGMEWGEDWEALFYEVARLVEADEMQVAQALAIEGEAYTIQIFASHSLDASHRVTDEFYEDDLGRHGFYEAGAFPGDNTTTHVLQEIDAEGQDIYRVVVGTFLSREQAQTAMAEIEDAGLSAFIRVL